jgi:hypothetical protein
MTDHSLLIASFSLRIAGASSSRSEKGRFRLGAQSARRSIAGCDHCFRDEDRCWATLDGLKHGRIEEKR